MPKMKAIRKPASTLTAADRRFNRSIDTDIKRIDAQLAAIAADPVEPFKPEPAFKSGHFTRGRK